MSDKPLLEKIKERYARLETSCMPLKEVREQGEDVVLKLKQFKEFLEIEADYDEQIKAFKRILGDVE